ncbi:hypothetical protein RUND412_004314 [Rhizina undulata]
MRMDTLPNEIYREIVSYLFGPDLASLRLVNHNLSAAATIFKFRSLNVRMTRRGLDNLLNVSRHPELARCVREITYPHHHLVLTRGGLESIASSAIRELMRKSFTTRFFHWYNENYAAQIKLENSGECVLTLETALSTMANVRAIIPGYFEFNALEELYGKWFGTLAETETTVVPRWSMELRNIIMDSNLLPNDGSEEATKAFLDLVKTLHCLRFKLDRFGGSGASLWRGFFSNDSVLWNSASLFQNLTCVYVCITTLQNVKDTRALHKDAKDGRMFKFLSFAPNLRMLSFEMRSYEFKEFPLFDILSRDYLWKHLHTFKLNIIHTINTEDLVEFLGRYARTLKFLSFGSGSTLNGEWWKVIYLLRQRLHLTGFEVEDPVAVSGDGEITTCYGTIEGHMIADYVLRRVAPFPNMPLALDS